MLAFGTAAPETGPRVRQDHRAEMVRWAASAAAVLVAYAIVIAALLSWKSPAPPEITPPPAATMIDLAPLPPPPQPVVAPPPPPEPVKPPEPKRVAKPLPRVLPPPPPKAVQMPAPPPVAVPAAPVQAPPAPAPLTAPSVAAPPSVDVLSRFESQLIAHLERYKHYPQSARARHQQGVVRLRFTMDRLGRVLSARIAQSSGVPALDDEVLAMIERAAPLPAFPSEIAQAQLDLLLPIAFSLR